MIRFQHYLPKLVLMSISLIKIRKMIRLHDHALKLILISISLIIIDNIFHCMSLVLSAFIITICFALHKPHRKARINAFPVNGRISRIEHKHGSDTLEIDILTLPLMHVMTMRFIGQMINCSFEDSNMCIEYASGITVTYKPFFGLSISAKSMHEHDQTEVHGFMWFGGRTCIKIHNWSSNQDILLPVINQTVIDGETIMVLFDKNKKNEYINKMRHIIQNEVKNV